MLFASTAHLSNDIGAAFIANPDFMDSSCLDIDPVSDAICRFRGILRSGVCDDQLAFDDQVSSELTVRVRRIMGVSVANMSAST